MKKIQLISISIVLLMSAFIGNAQTINKETAASENQVEAYYFHFTARCETCRTVEAQAKADLLNLYGDQVVFQAVNLDDASSKALAEKLKISGQTLLIVKGDQKINLTNEGFLYALTNPAKLKAIIKSKVDPLLDM